MGLAIESFDLPGLLVLVGIAHFACKASDAKNRDG
jgi:hypothetical protein